MRTKLIVMVLFSCLVFVFTGTALAEKPLTPESLDGVKVVDDAWVKTNIGSMMVFDVRKKAEYIEGHLPGATSVPYKEQSAKAVDFDASEDKLDMSKFPPDKNAKILIYCNGPRCWKSYKASVLLIKGGYTNVHWYRNSGFPGWKAKGYSVESN